MPETSTTSTTKLMPTCCVSDFISPGVRLNRPSKQHGGHEPVKWVGWRMLSMRQHATWFQQSLGTGLMERESRDYGTRRSSPFAAPPTQSLNYKAANMKARL